MKKFPESHNSLMPYLILENAGAFADFTAKVFGANQQYLGFREDGNTIMHAEIRMDNQTIMYCQSTPEYPAQPAGFFVYVEKADEAYEKAIAAGAASIMPPADQSYGRSCGVLDPFGNTWWITSI